MNSRKLKLIQLAALAWLSHRAIHRLRHHAVQRRLKTSPATAPVLQTWEGEGGALPGTGPQLGPDTGQGARH